MASYGATFDIPRPTEFDRTHVFLRLVIVIILAVLGGIIGWIYALLYLIVPALAAVLISQRGAERYIAEEGGNVVRWLRYYFGLHAYLFLLTDRLPGSAGDPSFSFDVVPGGSPTVGSALLRIVFALPHALVLGLLSIVGVVLMVIAAVMVLLQESYPEGIFSFNRGVLRWEARLLAYMASLVEEYPPFALDTGAEPSEA